MSEARGFVERNKGVLDPEAVRHMIDVGEGNAMRFGETGPHARITFSKDRAAREGLVFDKADFKLFPAFHVVGLAPNQFTPTMYPLGPDRTRGQIRFYFTSENDSASKLYARELTTMSILDVLCEDRDAIVSAQRGLESGAVSEVHFQDHEMLPRHLYETVQAMVADYQAEQRTA